MKKYRAALEGYAVSSEIKKILHEEGYVALRIISENSENIKICETLKINAGVSLPTGSDTVLTPKMLCNYGSVVVIDRDFPPFLNVEEI